MCESQWSKKAVNKRIINIPYEQQPVKILRMIKNDLPVILKLANSIHVFKICYLKYNSLSYNNSLRVTYFSFEQLSRFIPDQ